MKRFCKTCGVDTERYAKTTRAVGDCKPCARVRAKNWAARNPELAAASRRRKYLADRAARLEKARVYREVNAERIKEDKRQYQIKYKEKLRAKRLAQNYPKATITRERPALCECCGRPPGRRRGGLQLDHCHTTGAFRGWLCGPCNTGIGQMGDKLEDVLRAVAYLRRFDWLNDLEV